MVSFFGDFDTTETVVIPFNTFDSNDPSASVTLTNLANTDVHIHKDGGLTQRSSAAGVAVDVDVDTIAGCHWVTIDLSDNTDAGFYADGSQYSVRIEGVTVDAATINPWIGAFSIGRMLRPTTAGRTLDVTATGAAGIDWGNVENPTTAVDLSATDFQLVDTTTTLTNLPAITSNWLTAAGINAGALDGKGDWNIGKTGYALTQTFPANFADMSITITTGLVDITQAAADKVWGTAARVLTAGTNIALAKGVGLTGLNDIAATDVVSAGAITTLTGAVANVDLVDTLTTYTGNTPQTGDSFARIGAAGAGLTNIDLPDQTMDITGNLSGSVGSVAGAVGSVTARVTANTDQIAGVAAAATGLSLSADTVVNGTASGSPTTTTMISDVGITVDDQLQGRIIIFADNTTTAALRDQSTDITACTAASNTLTFTALTTAPVSGDTFVIL